MFHGCIFVSVVMVFAPVFAKSIFQMFSCDKLCMCNLQIFSVEKYLWVNKAYRFKAPVKQKQKDSSGIRWHKSKKFVVIVPITPCPSVAQTVETAGHGNPLHAEQIQKYSIAMKCWSLCTCMNLRGVYMCPQLQIHASVCVVGSLSVPMESTEL